MPREPLLILSFQSLSHARTQALFHTYGITVLMTDPHENALMESAIGTLKTECADHVFVSRAAARTANFRYLDDGYNRKRLHSALSYLCPDQFEQQFFGQTFPLFTRVKITFLSWNQKHLSTTRPLS